MTTMSEKKFIDARQMELDCWEFAKNIYSQGHDFDLFAGITRGGAQISIYMQEVFALLSGKAKGFTAIHAQSYSGIGEAGEVSVENIENMVKRVKSGSRVLIVDDIFDRGKTFKAVYDQAMKAVEGKGVTIKLAALYYKPENNVVDITPDFHHRIFASGDWIVLPHELDELSREELEQKGFTWPENL